MRRNLVLLLVMAGLGVPAAADAPPDRTTLDIFVYDGSMPEIAIVGATVAVTYDGGVAVGQTKAPHGRVRIRLPGVYDAVLVTTHGAGYCESAIVLVLDGRSRVGGHGVFVGLLPEPCGTER